MKLKYRIEVNVEPNYTGNPNSPYFWRIASVNIENPDSDWCTTTAGWANSPEEAFTNAKNFYDRFKKE